MPINWQDPIIRDRLLASIIGSYDSSVNCAEVARLFGQEATYSAIENFLRKPKREAAKLKAEAVGASGPAPSPARPKGPGTPKKVKGDGVKTGRIIKKKAANGSVSSSPIKSSPIKKEIFEFDIGFPSGPVQSEEEEENVEYV